ncbi:MAG: hypothetical protein J6C93_02875 [Clostridia bacterium]|nr:hypothetical protein [Clostridia bacterium]
MNKGTKNPDRIDRNAKKREDLRLQAQKEAIADLSAEQEEKEEKNEEE